MTAAERAALKMLEQYNKDELARPDPNIENALWLLREFRANPDFQKWIAKKVRA